MTRSHRKPIVLVALLATAGVASTNILLSRIDTATLEARTARAETRLLRAQLEQHVVTESLRVIQRDTKPDNVQLCLDRTQALRSAIFALVRTGNVAMPGDVSGEWATWPQRLEMRR